MIVAHPRRLSRLAAVFHFASYGSLFVSVRDFVCVRAFMSWCVCLHAISFSVSPPSCPLPPPFPPRPLSLRRFSRRERRSSTPRMCAPHHLRRTRGWCTWSRLAAAPRKARLFYHHRIIVLISYHADIACPPLCTHAPTVRSTQTAATVAGGVMCHRLGTRARARRKYVTCLER